MVEHHPDSVASRGGSSDAVRLATEKVAMINAAWDRIKRERGL
jgi:DnaJ like chaperone protein